MNLTDLTYTEKWDDVLRDDAEVIFLEGPSQVSKTTLAGIKLAKSAMTAPKGKTLFFLAGESTPTLYRNFVEPEMSIVKLMPYITRHVGGGSEGGQRIEIDVWYDGVKETKKIYFVGYSDKTSGNKILGSKPYLIMLDEVNKANDQFVKDTVTRAVAAGTKILATTNGDSPDKLFYSYFNACRPLDKYKDSVPPTTMADLLETPAKDGWRYYYFGLDDRPNVTQEWLQAMMTMHPVGSFEYYSKVLGIRQSVDGILYGHLLNKKHNVALHNLNIGAINEVLVGVDVGSGATKEGNARTVFVMAGFSQRFQRVVVLDGYISKEIGHLETTNELNLWLDEWMLVFAHKLRGVYVDNAEPALIATMKKRIRWHSVKVSGSIKQTKEVTARSRVSLKEQLIHQYRLLFLDTDGAQMVKRELAKVKGLNGVTLDDNELYNDINDALDYSLTPRFRELKAG